ncbi:MAG: flavodoxin family protein [Promethearchaeota archaeon]
MKILVGYYSETGNTKQIAQKIHEVASSKNEAEIKPIQKIVVDELKKYDLIFVGSACQDTDLARPFKRFLEKLPHNPRFKLAGFFTHATYTPEDTARRKALFENWAGRCVPTFERTCQQKEIDFLGYFHCMGAASGPIEVFIHKEIIVDDEEWKEYQLELKMHPDTKDLENVKAFTKEILHKTLDTTSP